MSQLTIFLLSDLHAFDANQNNKSPSFFDISKPAGDGTGNPIFDLKSLITSPTCNIKANYLICCGDLGDKAYPAATERAWKELQEIGNLLNAKQVISTVGNHDVDSRFQYNDHDAKGVLLELMPGFPFKDEISNCHFWTHHFAIFRDESLSVRFVVLNSSAYHGEKEEYAHGRISQRTLKRLKAKLSSEKKPNLNVLVCHHHPQKQSELNLGDYDDMKGGYELLSMLDAAEYGPWVIFHGHKHYPKISYSQGGTSTPVVFSAGSCAAVLSPELQGYARNQAYLVHINIPDVPSTTCLGQFNSWDWAPGRGWAKSQPDSGLPAHGGFGFRGDIGGLAATIARDFPDGGHWKNVYSKISSVQNLLPADLKQLCSVLTNTYNYAFEQGNEGNPILFQKI